MTARGGIKQRLIDTMLEPFRLPGGAGFYRLPFDGSTAPPRRTLSA